MWISPIDGSSVTDTVDDNIDDPNKMPCNEVNNMAIKIQPVYLYADTGAHSSYNQANSDSDSVSYTYTCSLQNMCLCKKERSLILMMICVKLLI